jgi:hypothetical protein
MKYVLFDTLGFCFGEPRKGFHFRAFWEYNYGSSVEIGFSAGVGNVSQVKEQKRKGK